VTGVQGRGGGQHHPEPWSEAHPPRTSERQRHHGHQAPAPVSAQGALAVAGGRVGKPTKKKAAKAAWAVRLQQHGEVVSDAEWEDRYFLRPPHSLGRANVTLP
jgi:hypothetical protein